MARWPPAEYVHYIRIMGVFYVPQICNRARALSVIFLLRTIKNNLTLPYKHKRYPLARNQEHAVM